MLKGCPNWLAFVEGVNGIHSVTVTGGRTAEYYDWWGGALEEAGDDLIEYNVENKLVWAPHYYNTGVSPQWYLYASGEWQESGILQDYVELSDEDLKANIDITMDVMFGYLMNKTSYAMVLGEFAGLYSKDAHPKLTTDYNIEFNPADTAGDFTEGLLEDDWLTPNKNFLEGMAAMDKIKDLKKFPCFLVEIKKEEREDWQAYLEVPSVGAFALACFRAESINSSGTELCTASIVLYAAYGLYIRRKPYCSP
ncbi:hypothetical protein ON010_g15856 [Phytophthora cinnamomi]|nr:hypothetical protein ON010_g15856 [Phytophthora cinnamomi]